MTSSTDLKAVQKAAEETNLRSAQLELTAAQTAALDAASQPHVADYP